MASTASMRASAPFLKGDVFSAASKKISSEGTGKTGTASRDAKKKKESGGLFDDIPSVSSSGDLFGEPGENDEDDLFS